MECMGRPTSHCAKKGGAAPARDFLKQWTMPFEFIQIPANGQGSAKEELNKLLRSLHRHAD